jgi:hypothetical protein
MTRVLWTGERAGLLALALLAFGCSRPLPVFTEAEGTALLNGKPLPYAQVEFVPMLEGYGAEYNSVGLTDENGHFTLACRDKSGAVIAQHRVLVREGPLPPEARGSSDEAQEAMSADLARRPNRPIPAVYRSVAQTPLSMEVTAGQTHYDLQLKRVE